MNNIKVEGWLHHSDKDPNNFEVQVFGVVEIHLGRLEPQHFEMIQNCLEDQWPDNRRDEDYYFTVEMEGQRDGGTEMKYYNCVSWFFQSPEEIAANK